jgi:hypothetical protein
VEQARAGLAGVLVVLGEPGVGKSALVRDLVSAQQESAGVRVLLQTARADHDSKVATTSLYRCIRGLLDRDLITEVALAPGEDARRRRYQVTAAGLVAARTEHARLLRLFAASPRLAGARP